MQAALLTGNPVNFPEKIRSQKPTNVTSVSIKIAGDGIGRKGAASHAKATRTKNTFNEGTASKQSRQNRREINCRKHKSKETVKKGSRAAKE